MFLTAEDLHDLTGYVMPSAQIRWLDRAGWEYVVSGLGRPKVLRAYAEQRLGLAHEKPSAHTEPDFSHWGGVRV